MTPPKRLFPRESGDPGILAFSGCGVLSVGLLLLVATTAGAQWGIPLMAAGAFLIGLDGLRRWGLAPARRRERGIVRRAASTLSNGVKRAEASADATGITPSRIDG